MDTRVYWPTANTASMSCSVLYRSLKAAQVGSLMKACACNSSAASWLSPSSFCLALRKRSEHDRITPRKLGAGMIRGASRTHSPSVSQP